ncbi:hypothetical protein DPV78_000269 [Talaromyces pinophilus]|nr:hypothetical protein DPV78_000269 [Talaromyces pinophilus]
MAWTQDSISTAQQAPWPLRRHGGGQWVGWAPWPGPYGLGVDQDGCMCPCPDVYGLGASAYGPLLRVDIPSAHPDT